MPKKRKSKKRRRRKYTMSEKALAQRRGAARKHGQYASTPLRQVLPSCNRRQCPLGKSDGSSGYPCEIKKRTDEKGVVIESCPLLLAVNPQIRNRYLAAIRDGEFGGVAEITATSLAVQTDIAMNELSKLREDGFTISVPMFDDEGNHVGDIPKKNPSADPTLKLLDNLGHTAAQQAITPKSASEKKRDEGVGGFLDAMSEMRERFGSVG